MALKVEIPEDFEPIKPIFLKDMDRPDIQYWVYSDNKGKTYKHASAEEVYKWTKSLFNRIPLEDSSMLGLMTARSVALDASLEFAVFQSQNLFGRPEHWENLRNWFGNKTNAKEKKKK